MQSDDEQFEAHADDRRARSARTGSQHVTESRWPKQRDWKRWAGAACCALLVAAAGCSDDTEPGGGTGINNGVDTGPVDTGGGTDADDTGSDAADDTGPTDTGPTDGGADADTGPADTGRDAGDTGSDTSPATDTGTDAGADAGPGFSGTCQNIVDAGALGTTPFSHTIAAGDLADGIKTVCSAGETSGHEAIFSFTAELFAEVQIEVTGATGQVFTEIREGGCDDETASKRCLEQAAHAYDSATTVQQYLVVEAGDGGDLTGATVTLSTQDSTIGLCPNGERYCASTTEVTTCDPGTGDTQTLVCPSGCASDQCVGDTCAAPVAVTGSAQLSGDIRTYTNKTSWGTADATCDAGSPFVVGEDIVFEISGAAAGDTIVVDTTNDTISNTIFIQHGTCSETAACVATGSDTLSHTVTDAGTYYVIIDWAGGFQSQTFDYRVEHQTQ